MTEYIQQAELPPHICGVIALTSWKKRIQAVGLTIYNLYKLSGNKFHIVLTLSIEEFPHKEEELPADLVNLQSKGIVEILWVFNNWKSFKKILFTMYRYQYVPVISADDDTIYLINYAQKLYDIWVNHKNCVIKWTTTPNTVYLAVDGHGTLYTYDVFGKYAIRYLDLLDNKTIYLSKDDDFYNQIICRYNIPYIGAGLHDIYITHNDNDSLTKQSVTTLDENIAYFNNKFNEWGMI